MNKMSGQHALVTEGKAKAEAARKAAVLYYAESQTMATISKKLGVSRSTVSRLLAYARKSGIVQITIRPPFSSESVLTMKLKQRFHVDVQIVDVESTLSQNRLLQVVSKVAAGALDQMVQSGDTVGIAWGNTTSEVVQHLPSRDLGGVSVVQLNGAVSTTSSGSAHVGFILSQAADRWNANVIHFPVPAFFDKADTKKAMWQESAVKRVLEYQRKTSVAVFGVGAFKGEMPSHVYSAGYLSTKEVYSLSKGGVVGDVCTVLLKKDGTWRNIELNKRASGPNPAMLARIPRRLCVVAGPAKAEALLAALNAGVMTDLVCDRPTAELVWKLANRAK